MFTHLFAARHLRVVPRREFRLPVADGESGHREGHLRGLAYQCHLVVDTPMLLSSERLDKKHLRLRLIFRVKQANAPANL